MTEFTLVLLAVLAGVAAGIPVLIGFRSKGRRRCWRCRVWMLPARTRLRVYPPLPIGRCEGCGVWCLALGPRLKKTERRHTGLHV